MPSTLHQYASDTLDARKRQYIETPQNIIEHYNSEQENINSYNGRQLLEMLQNADDAAGLEGCEKRVFIRLQDGVLTIANHGHPFSEGGLESILYSYLSPKLMEQNMIGQKGLGFRSILSWADEVTISSLDINLVFSKKEAISFLEEVVVEKPSIANYLKRKSNDPSPIAILRVPRISSFGSDLSGSYDTIITIKLKSGVEEDVQEQINNLVDKETLLFLNNIKEVELQSPERNEVIIKSMVGDLIGISLGEPSGELSDPEFWNVNSRTGSYLGKNYQLKIAWTPDLRTHSSLVHSFFKTKDVLDFPGLVHGTFDLTPDRNHLNTDPNGHNKFLLKELAAFMADTAELIAAGKKMANYSALSFVNVNSENIAGIFKEYGFLKHLSDAVSNRMLFPTVNGDYINLDGEPIYYDVDIAQYLKGDDVANLLPHTADENLSKFIKSFKHLHFSPELFSRIIAARLGFTATQLSALLLCFVNSNAQQLNAMNGNYEGLAPIFIDDVGLPIPWKNEMFLPNEHSSEPINMPPEVNISFFNRNIADEMLRTFRISDYEYLDSRLGSFKFHRFSIKGFAEVLKEQFLETPTLESVTSFHFYLYKLRNIQIDRNELMRSDSSLKYFKGISRSGKLFPLSELYFGEEYGEELTEDLLKHNEDLLLASPEQFGFGKGTLLRGYFEWLGVNPEPQSCLEHVIPGHRDYAPFKDFVLSSYDYNTQLGSICYTNRTQASNGIKGFYVEGIMHLTGILEHADHSAILLWIKENYKVKRALESRNDTSGQPMLDINNSSKAFIFNKMPNYIKWRFGNTSWIPAEGGLVPPLKCCTSKNIGNILSPLLVRPKLDERGLKVFLDTDAAGLEGYYRLIGIHQDLSSLSTEQLYTMLNGLRGNDPTGKMAKALYQEVLNNYEAESIDTNNEQYQKFITGGYIWCGKDHQFSYEHIQNTYYLDTKRYGENITAEFSLVPLARKQGNQRVNKLFGVKPLTGLNFKVNGLPRKHPLNDTFRTEMEHFKALAYSLVYQNDSTDRIQRILRGLNLNLVSRLEGTFKKDNLERDFELQNYDFVMTGADNSPAFFIKVPMDDSSAGTLRGRLAFAETIAEIFSTIFRSETNRSFLRELFSRQPSDREELLVHEIQVEGFQKLQRSRELLGLNTDQRANFWRAIFHAMGIPVSDEALAADGELALMSKKIKCTNSTREYLMLQENFRSLYSSPFIKAVYELLVINNIEVARFHEQFEELDFSGLMGKHYDHFKTVNLTKFHYGLYSVLQSESSWQERAEYFGNCFNFEQSSHRLQDGFLNDVQEYLFNRSFEDFGVDLKTTLVPSDWVVTSIFEQMHAESGFFVNNDFHLNGLSELQVQSLILFGEFSVLEEFMEKALDLHSVTEISGAENTHSGFRGDFRGLSDAMDAIHNYGDFTINEAQSQKSFESGRPVVYSDGGPRNFNGQTKLQHLDSEQIGFIAEKFVFETLRMNYPHSNVQWKSENGRKAGKHILGMAGHGYDIEYMDGERKIYVEVKCIVNPENGFFMSNNELQFALSHAEDYFLITVENISRQIPVMTAYPRFFMLGEDETLFDNKSFSIQNENYKICFKRTIAN